MSESRDPGVWLGKDFDKPRVKMLIRTFLYFYKHAKFFPVKSLVAGGRERKLQIGPGDVEERASHKLRIVWEK